MARQSIQRLRDQNADQQRLCGQVNCGRGGDRPLTHRTLFVLRPARSPLLLVVKSFDLLVDILAAWSMEKLAGVWLGG